MATPTLLYDEYALICQEYKAKYGEDTVVLMEVGSFMEFYDCDKNIGVDVSRLCQILNIQATRKNKSVLEISRTNPKMAGVPSVAATKYINVLVESGFTVVLYRQIEGDSKSPSGGKQRKVTDVISAATCETILSVADSLSSDNLPPSILSIHYEQISKQTIQSVGWSLIQLHTGKTSVGETIAPTMTEAFETLRSWVVDRCVAKTRITEVVIGMDESNNMDEFLDELCSYISQSRKIVRQRNPVVDPYIQNEILGRAFPSRGILTPAEYINLERRPFALASFALILKYAEEHNAILIDRLLPPTITVDDDNNIKLSSGTLQQLGVTGPELGKGSLMNLLNNCRTAMGRRAFRERLVAPVCDRDTIEQRWDDIDMFMDNHENIRSALSNIGLDLDIIFRSLTYKKCVANTIVGFGAAIQACKKCLQQTKGFQNDIVACESICQMINNSLDQDGIIKRGIYPLVDAAQDELNDARAIFIHVTKVVNDAIGQEYAKFIEDESNSGPFITITAKRWATAVGSGAIIKAVISPWFKGSEAKVVEGTGKPRLNHPAIDMGASNRVKCAYESLTKATSDALASLQTEIVMLHADAFFSINSTISNIDIATCCAYNAVRFGHVRPTFDQNIDLPEFAATALRHPVIEALPGRIETYVPNDVSIGSNAGMVLYGINAVGKSSVMKAVGLAVIMAQSGMFVAASSLTLKHPFERIFTRIGLRDNLCKGHSTFVVEMLDLREILRSAQNNKSLVIGDELCAGTESASALAIVGAGIAHLTRRGVPFIFATHLHELMTIPCVSSLRDDGLIQVMHLSVHHDDIKKCLVFDRRLTPGPGLATYGLEVCKSLDLDPSFLATADAIRESLLNNGQSNKSTKSRYNARLVVNKCGICGEAATETHHIIPQANKEVSRKLLNHLSNLVPLCEKCHHATHTGTLQINGYVQTSNGLIVNSS